MILFLCFSVVGGGFYLSVLIIYFSAFALRILNILHRDITVLVDWA